MNRTTQSRLLELNRQFYQTFAVQFSATRQRLQPGVRCFLEHMACTDEMLDLGCGNGELARQLAKRGHSGTYSGLDFSPALLDHARRGLPSNFQFFQADLANPDWDTTLASRCYDIVLAFAVLHHLPGERLRLQVLHKIRALLLPGGRFIHSAWQFLNSPRLKTRIQPWETIGLPEAEVDPGDYLLDWRQGGTGLRYVHHFSQDELAALAASTGFTITEMFLSDGENHRLGLYQVWVKE